MGYRSFHQLKNFKRIDFNIGEEYLVFWIFNWHFDKECVNLNSSVTFAVYTITKPL